MSDLTLPDDLKQRQDALDDRDLAKQAYDSYTGSLRVKALLAGVMITARLRVEKLRKEHVVGSPTISSEQPYTQLNQGEAAGETALDETYGIYSEDEYHDNRERLRGLK